MHLCHVGRVTGCVRSFRITPAARPLLRLAWLYAPELGRRRAPFFFALEVTPPQQLGPCNVSHTYKGFIKSTHFLWGGAQPA